MQRRHRQKASHSPRVGLRARPPPRRRRTSSGWRSLRRPPQTGRSTAGNASQPRSTASARTVIDRTRTVEGSGRMTRNASHAESERQGKIEKGHCETYKKPPSTNLPPESPPPPQQHLHHLHHLTISTNATHMQSQVQPSNDNNIKNNKSIRNREHQEHQEQQEQQAITASPARSHDSPPPSSSLAPATLPVRTGKHCQHARKLLNSSLSISPSLHLSSPRIISSPPHKALITPLNPARPIRCPPLSIPTDTPARLRPYCLRTVHTPTRHNLLTRLLMCGAAAAERQHRRWRALPAFHPVRRLAEGPGPGRAPPAKERHCFRARKPAFPGGLTPPAKTTLASLL